MKVTIPLLVLMVPFAPSSRQAARHPFVPARITPSVDSFAFVTKITGRPAGYLVQTVARDGNDNIRIGLDYDLGATLQRVEMVVNGRTLAPMAHWESLRRRVGGEARGEVRFDEGRARGAYILSKGVIDLPIDSGLVDDDASTVLLSALPLENGGPFAFRTFASPGEVHETRVIVAGVETISVRAGRFEAYRLTVMARDTSSVFVTTAMPRRVVLVRLMDGSQEMQLLRSRGPR